MRTIPLRPPRRAALKASALFLALALPTCDSGPTEPNAGIPEDADTGRIRVLVPEAYELANVVLALTSYAQGATDLVYKQGNYYQDVTEHFDAMRSHGSMASLQLPADEPLRHYYEFRENSAAYGFADGRLVRGERYAIIWQPNLFGSRLSAAETFAEASDFRAFFQDHAPYYASLTARYREVSRLEDIIEWLEGQFTEDYDRYNVFLSPLVNTRYSAVPQQTTIGSEALLFVGGPDAAVDPSLPAAEREAIVQRILFTELDHLFINPVSDTWESSILTALREKATWTTDGSPAFDSQMTVFNEYMTWAVFTLWLDDLDLPEATFEAIVTRMEDQMEGPRRFPLFREFNRELLRLWRERGPNEQVPNLYSDIITWAEAR